MSLGYAVYEYWKENEADSRCSDMKNIVLCILSLILEDPEAVPPKSGDWFYKQYCYFLPFVSFLVGVCVYVGVNTGVYPCLGLLVSVSCVCACVPIVLHVCLCVLGVVYIYGVHILVYMQKWKSANKGHRPISAVITEMPSASLFEIGFSLSWSSLIRLGWPACYRDPTVFASNMQKLCEFATVPRCLCGFWTVDLRSSWWWN